MKCSSLQRPHTLRRTVVQPVCKQSCKPPGSTPYKPQPTGIKDVLQKAATGAVSLCCAMSLLLSPTPVTAEPTVLRLPASGNPEILAAQKTLVEAWSIVGDSFVDPAFNGHDWEDELRSHMAKAYKAPNTDAAWSEIGSMLEDLGDPYTRRIPPEEYASFLVSSDGELQGVGMLIANEPVHGHLLVLAPIKGGPADRAGVLPGDEVLSINGQSTEGWNGEKAARILRGHGGTAVRVKLARRTEQLPGVPGRPDPKPRVQYKEVSLKRERVMLSPLFYAAIPQPFGGPLGYLRLTSFSNNAAEDMRAAISDLESHGASSYILDLRNNPGGLVRSGIDIARLWMDGHPVVFNVSSRQDLDYQDLFGQGLAPGDGVLAQVVDSEGSALTHDPLVVLVNGASASASEILTGALHDNHRAVIVGDSHTYGKGRIQSVFELEDGSALFVTVAKYQTPNGTDIDKKGINPDIRCMAPIRGADDEFRFAPGLPLDSDGEAALLEQLMGDGCMLAARSVLDQQTAVAAATVQVAANLGR